MTFEIGFNKNEDYHLLEKLAAHIGARYVIDDSSGEFFDYYLIEINTLEELQQLYYKINLFLTNNKNNYEYSMVIIYDPPTIFLDSSI